MTHGRSSGPSHHRGFCCPVGSISNTAASDSLPAGRPLPEDHPVIERRAPTSTPQHRSGRGGSPQFPSPPSERSEPRTPDSPSRLHLQDLHRFHGLRRDYRGSALSSSLTTRQASLHATDRSVAPTTVAFGAGLRPDPFPDRAASLLPGLLAATRTGLTPAGDDELMFGSGHRSHHLRNAGHTSRFPQNATCAGSGHNSSFRPKRTTRMG